MENVSAKEKGNNIEWDRFEPGFVRLERNVPKKLKLTNWRQGTWFDKPGIRLDVIEEDSVPKNKIFTVISRRLLSAFEPIITNAEKNGKTVISVTITKIGDGFDTSYEVDASDEFKQK